MAAGFPGWQAAREHRDTARGNSVRSCFPSAELQRVDRHMILPVHCESGWLTAPKAAANQLAFAFAVVWRHTHRRLPCPDRQEKCTDRMVFNCRAAQSMKMDADFSCSSEPGGQMIWGERYGESPDASGCAEGISIRVSSLQGLAAYLLEREVGEGSEKGEEPCR